MVNEEYEPNKHEERVLEFIKQDGDRFTNRWVREQTSMPAERVDPALNNLEKAGWVRRLTRGFYEFVEDPRQRDRVEDQNDTDVVAWVRKNQPVERSEIVDAFQEQIEQQGIKNKSWWKRHARPQLVDADAQHTRNVGWQID